MNPLQKRLAELEMKVGKITGDCIYDVLFISTHEGETFEKAKKNFEKLHKRKLKEKFLKVEFV